MPRTALLVNLSPWPVGGFTSVTAHAFQCLTAAGWSVQVVRMLRDRTEAQTRTMAYGVPYRNVSVSDGLAMARHTPTLVTGVARAKDLKDPDTIAKLLKAGARVVVHGYTEHKQFQHLPLLAKGGGVCVRRSMCGVYEGVKDFIPHPYYAVVGIGMRSMEKRKRAGCVAMAVPHKHPEIVLEANRLVPSTYRVEFRGREDRMFAKYKLSERYPEYKLSGGFPADVHPSEVCQDYQIVVDLTVFGAGNGGTQYSFMEAMNAGSVCVVHREWLRDVGDMRDGVNCLAVADAQELATLLRRARVNQLIEQLLPGYNTLLMEHGSGAFSEAFRGLFKC